MHSAKSLSVQWQYLFESEIHANERAPRGCDSCEHVQSYVPLCLYLGQMLQGWVFESGCCGSQIADLTSVFLYVYYYLYMICRSLSQDWWS